MQHTDIIVDTDAYFEINPTTREITQISNKFSVAQYDHNSERFTFSIPRFVDGHDMLTSTKVEVHYVTKSGTTGLYPMNDLRSDPEDEDKVICSWLLSRNATSDKGPISFIVRYTCILEDGTINYTWSTAIYTRVTVLEGLDCTPEELGPYIDALEQLKAEVESDLIKDFTGVESHSGCKGFRIKQYIGTTSGEEGAYILDSVQGLEVGDVVSLITSRNYTDDENFILSIVEETKQVTIRKAYDDLSTEAEVLESPWSANVLSVSAKPDVGTIDIGIGAHTEGYKNKALRVGSHAEGYFNVSNGYFSHTEGRENYADYAGHAEGFRTSAPGEYAHSEGFGSKAIGAVSHSEGQATEASGHYSHAEGYSTFAKGYISHVEGQSTVANGSHSHAEGWESNADGTVSHAEGYRVKASGDYSHAEGRHTEAIGAVSHAEGYKSIASGEYSHVEGYLTKASGKHSHSEGYKTEASGHSSHAEGQATQAKGAYSHAEGYNSISEGSYSHAEGNQNHAGYSAHAEGHGTSASGEYSHTEGLQTQATGAVSHAEGCSTEAKAAYSHVEGYYTITGTNSVMQHVEGRFNIEDTEGKYAHIVGNGTGVERRSNAHTLDWEGNAWFAGATMANSMAVKSKKQNSSLVTIDDLCALPQIVNIKIINGATSAADIPFIIDGQQIFTNTNGEINIEKIGTSNIDIICNAPNVIFEVNYYRDIVLAITNLENKLEQLLNN